MNLLDVKITNPFQSKVPKGFYDAIRGHTGEDKLLAVGTEITMPIDLKCVSIKTQQEMGLTAYFEDKNGNIHVFAHNSSISATIGEMKEAGRVLCVSGNSGARTTAPHSHWEVISKTPYKGFEMMTRTLGEFKGFNLPPTQYVKDMLAVKQSPVPHWSDEAFEWALQSGILSQKRSPDESLEWGEFITVLHKFSKLNKQ